jgi:hypothetical protein
MIWFAPIGNYRSYTARKGRGKTGYLENYQFVK